MNHSELYKELTTLSSDELCYKRSYEAGYIEKYTPTDLTFPCVEEKLYFSSTQENKKLNVCLIKHNCYCQTTPHTHDYFELFYVMSGKIEQEIQGKILQMTQGDFCLIPPGTLHEIIVNSDSTVINILIRHSAYEQIFSSLLDDNNVISTFFSSNSYGLTGSSYLIFHTQKDETLLNLVLDMYWEFMNKKKYYEMILNTQLSSLFGQLLRNYESSYELPAFTNRFESQVFGMIYYMRQNYQDITLPQLSQKFHYTPGYTSKLIHDVTGRTFSELLTHIRMEQATKLLQNSSAAILDIGYSVGYNTPEHFVRLFKKIYHMTPTQYRKEYQPNLMVL